MEFQDLFATPLLAACISYAWKGMVPSWLSVNNVARQGETISSDNSLGVPMCQRGNATYFLKGEEAKKTAMDAQNDQATPKCSMKIRR